MREHFVGAAFRKAAPWALKAIEAELERVESRRSTAQDYVARMSPDASEAKITAGLRRLEQARIDRDKLNRLRAEIREAIRA